MDFESASAWLTELPSGTGLACYNDDVAGGVLSAAQEIGRPIPKELGIVGSDNSAIARHSTPHITTFGIDYELYYDLLVDTVVQNRKLPASALTVDIQTVQGGTT